MSRVSYTENMRRIRWAMRTVHVRWQIAAICLGFVGGVWAAQFEAARNFGALPWVLCACLLLIASLWKRKAWLLATVFLAGTLFGIARGSAVQTQLGKYSGLYEKVITLRGKVADDMDINKRGESVLRLSDVQYDGHKLAGMVWVVLSDKAPIERSDEVTVRGKLDHGFGTFAGSIYSAQLVKVQRAQPGDAALHVRDWFAGNVRSVLSEPEASLGVGFLVGQRRALPEDLANSLKVAGLMHIVVASGYNLTILVRLARRGLEKISKYLTVLFSGSLIVSFIAITGMSPSMSRAGLVAGLSLAAWYYGRTIHPIVLLAVAMGVTVAVNPSYAWGDIGWLLSFSAFAGVMICAPLLQAYYFGNQKPGLLRQVVGETVAAWLFTLPILLVVFGTMSNVAVLANLLIVPLIPLAMLLTFVAGLVHVAVPFIAPFFAFPAEALLSYMVQIAKWTANLDWAQRDVHLAWWQGVLFYVGLAIFCAYMWYKTKHSLKGDSIID